MEKINAIWTSDVDVYVAMFTDDVWYVCMRYRNVGSESL